MSKKRSERVKEKMQRQEKARVKLRQEKAAHERFAYQTRKKQTPIINKDDSALVRNNKKLLEMAADHEALLKFREDNKDKIDEHYANLEKEHTEIAEKMNDNVGNESRDD